MNDASIYLRNNAGRTFDVFFYGLFMDARILEASGVVCRAPRVAHVDGCIVKLGDKAMLLRSPGGRAHGMLFQLTHAEMDALYANLHGYRAEPFQAILANGEATAAISMVHIDPPVHSDQDSVYADRWHKIVRQLGLPGADLSPVP